MKLPRDIIETRVSDAMDEVTGLEGCKGIVRVASNPKFGDYQANGAMALAKKVKTNPRKLAEKIIEKLDIDDICEKPEIAGPGFMNFSLKEEYVKEKILEIFSDKERLGVPETEDSEKAVVDFSGPNIAKQMHVGHLRSTIIGDCICRVLDFMGDEVVRQNHIGDWGTQFGMLIAYMKRKNPEVIENPDSVHISDLEQFYKNAKALCDNEADFQKQARQEVTRLHSHDPDTVKVWEHIVNESRRHYQPVYDLLEVDLHEENERGESFYAQKLPKIVEEMKEKRLAENSEDAICIFLEGFKNKEGEPLPFIIQKSDGAYLYATTDLAALKYRIEQIGADKIIYVTDSRQKLHFEMLFKAAEKAGWLKDDIELSHVMFGTVLGEDNKPFKTRSGENIKLMDLLQQAISRARDIVEEKNPGLSDKKKEDVSKAVGIGAVKYADFSNNRTSDYIFSLDRMLAMEGNTAPYMQYAYARVRSIGRKGKEKGIDVNSEISSVKKINIEDKSEKDIAKHLIRYGEVIESCAKDYMPNYLTGYLYDLAQKFSSFYTNCPVLQADEHKRASRLLLCELTARTIRHGLNDLLGIRVVEQM